MCADQWTCSLGKTQKLNIKATPKQQVNITDIDTQTVQFTVLVNASGCWSMDSNQGIW